MKFKRIHVLEKEDLDDIIKCGECTCLENIDVKKTDFCWDYAQTALVNEDDKKCIIWNDNIHSDVTDDIDNFLDGIKYTGVNIDVEECVMLSSALKEKYLGARY